MHGFTNEENPLYSGLVFSVGDNSSPNLGDVNLRGMGENTTDGATAISENTSTDGFLHVFEIFGMKLNAELAVLSACKTGLGKQFRGEGIMSLARAFRAAGCPNVVMSLWEANDQSTRQIMERFYFHLKAGKPKDEALYLAKHDYLSSAAADRINPVFWSTFVLIGDATPVFSPDYTIWFYFLGGILILGVMCLAIFLYRRKPGQHI